ncbi:MAG: 23S rRNA (adenine(2503)-C(2))-methyltransferase RlmN [Firmicutes bacterium]|nr:23S rRNA (adenine(2503)-C(2))-methyltransferase RlmN [Bacillota bacterium]
MGYDWYSQSVEQLQAHLKELGEQGFRAKQIFKWLHQRHAVCFDEMTDLGKTLREKLQAKEPLMPVQIEQKQIAADGTGKFLIRLADGKAIESVLMKYKFGYSLCISSQAGCRMGCRFCASTLAGLERNLSAGEMVQQVYAIEREANVNISHIVVMGCGEPFDNFEELIKFLQLIHHEDGKGLSLRNITVSTCGLVDKIKTFADLDTPVTLAISLHAPNDEIREKIMRIAQAVSMDDLMKACQYYLEKTNKRITFEYILIRDVNDSTKCAHQLADRLKGMLCHVNLIPVNPVKECGFERPEPERIERFVKTLEQRHVPVTLRREMGKNIDAACGQLRAKAERKTDGRVN